MSDIIGRNIEAGVSLEASRGVAESTVSKWMRNVSCSIVERAEHVIDDTSRGRLEDSDGRRVIKQWVEGDMEGIVHADALGYLLKSLYGTVNTATVTGAVKDHTFTLLQNIQHPTLSVFVKDGSVQQKVFKGGMLKSFELNAAVDNYVRFKAAFQAISGASNAASPSYGTEYDFIAKDITVKFATSVAGLGAATAIKAKDLNLVWDQGLIVDHVFGAYAPNDILNSKMSIEGDFTVNYGETTYKDLYLADTDQVCQITIQGAADIGSANNPTITITLYKIRIMDWNRSGGNDELVTQPVSFKAFYSPADTKASQVVVRNLTASY
jgi:hypothetical protein